MTYHGLLCIDKAPGCTSHDVVGEVRRALRQRKVGHCGTLDPMATGLLLITTGHATRLTRFLIGAPKVYEGVATLGAATDTYDAHGTVVSEVTHAHIDEAAIDSCMAEFVGEYEQTAPPYSAKKVNGKKLYELARAGLEVPEKRSAVEIFGLERIGELEDAGRFRFRLACASGTYVRSVINDLGRRLSSAAHLSGLRRTEIGPFKLDRSLPQSKLIDFHEADSPPDLSSQPAWLPLDAIPLPFVQHVVDARGERRIHHGQTVLAPRLDADEGDWVHVRDSRGSMIAVGVVSERVAEAGLAVVQPKVVFK